MTKSTDDKLENWRLAGVLAKNANRILKEIKEGGPAFQKIRDGMAEARKRKLQREHFRRERRVALEVEMNRRRFRFPVEHGFCHSRVHPWAPQLPMMS